MRAASSVRHRDLRRSRRAPKRQGAWIALEGNASRIPCTLWDISAEGARLAAPHPKSLPACFTLLLSHDGASRRRCRAVWRNETQLGVQFIEQTEEADETRPGAPRAPVVPPPATRQTAAPPPTARRPAPVLNTAPLLLQRAKPGAGLEIVFALVRMLLIGAVCIPLAYQLLSRPELKLNERLCSGSNVLCDHPQVAAIAAMLMAAIIIVSRKMKRE